MNPEAIEGHLMLVLLEWMIIIAVAWVFGRLGKRFGQSLAVGEIFAGLLLGPSALGLIWPKNWPAVFPPETQQSLGLLGKLGALLPKDLFTMFVIMALATTAMTGPILKWRLPRELRQLVPGWEDRSAKRARIETKQSHACGV